MNIYLDESIHTRANFIVLAAICARPEDIARATDALREHGFTPGEDEFKSSMRMDGHRSARELREQFRRIIGGCKIAIGVCAASERSELMALAGRICHAIIPDTNGEGAIHIDQGMKFHPLSLPDDYSLRSGCDSKQVIGIQLADCCAHFVSTMILGELGLFKKMVPADRAYPGDPGELEFAWELWASLRYALAGSESIEPAGEDGFGEPLLKPFGLVISDDCDEKVKEAVRNRFGKVWVGCIH